MMNPSPSEFLVATMLSGSCQELVHDAIESVLPWVDKILLIDTGIDDDTVAIAAEFAGGKLVTASYTWSQDFAAARNFALTAAVEHGAAWAMTLDTDERMDLSAFSNRDALLAKLNGKAKIITWMVAARDHSYTKERFIRVPSKLRWTGRTHEALIGSTRDERAELIGCHFWEVTKSPEQFTQKLQRDLIVLHEETNATPQDSRWWHYLGQTHESLGQTQKAIDAFTHCGRLDGWSEQSAWACFCAARCLCHLERYREAEEIAAYGLTRDSSFPELPWIAGWCSYQLQQDERAVHWSTMAASLGAVTGSNAAERRIGFREESAWYESPYDTLRFAHRRLGNEVAANQAEELFERAKAMRLRRSP